jgi:hypothetical protein
MLTDCFSTTSISILWLWISIVSSTLPKPHHAELTPARTSQQEQHGGRIGEERHNQMNACLVSSLLTPRFLPMIAKLRPLRSEHDALATTYPKRDRGGG